MAGKFAHGTKFSVTVDSAFVAVADLTSITGVDISVDEIDVTSHDSVDGFREFEPGLADAGSVSIEGNLTNVTSQSNLYDLLLSKSKVAMKIEFPASLATWTFTGFVTSFSTEGPMDDKATFSATIKVTGKPVLA